jgi:hypothetical protein
MTRRLGESNLAEKILSYIDYGPTVTFDPDRFISDRFRDVVQSRYMFSSQFKAFSPEDRRMIQSKNFTIIDDDFDEASSDNPSARVDDRRFLFCMYAVNQSDKIPFNCTSCSPFSELDVGPLYEIVSENSSDPAKMHSFASGLGCKECPCRECYVQRMCERFNGSDSDGDDDDDEEMRDVVGVDLRFLRSPLTRVRRNPPVFEDLLVRNNEVISDARPRRG